MIREYIRELANATKRAFSILKYNSRIKKFPAQYDIELKDIMENPECTDAYKLSYLNRYFVTSYVNARSPLGSRAYYPGLKSCNGADIDAIEGFSRIGPLLATIAMKSDGSIALLNGSMASAIELLKVAILSGTDLGGKESWGAMGDYDQKLAEAADIALALWISREVLWEKLEIDEKHQISGWLKQCLNRKIVENNWHLFPYLISLVLSSLGEQVEAQDERLTRVLGYHAGQGWFNDGPKGGIDLYNAWAFHYTFYWIQEIGVKDEKLSMQIDDARRAFVQSYKYLLSPKGFPMFGRSLCYRFAVPAPLLISYASGDGLLAPGFVRRSFFSVWQYFIARNGVSEGIPTQGVYEQDESLVDNYSGPASSLWGLRSLVLLNYMEKDVEFWQAEPSLFKVEKKDFVLRLRQPPVIIVGNRDEGYVRFLLDSVSEECGGLAEPKALFRKIKAKLLFRVDRNTSFSEKKTFIDNENSSEADKGKSFCG